MKSARLKIKEFPSSERLSAGRCLEIDFKFLTFISPIYENISDFSYQKRARFFIIQKINHLKIGTVQGSVITGGFCVNRHLHLEM